MDADLKTLLASLLAADPDAPLDDNGRERVMYAMLAMHSREHITALWRFAGSITNEFKRSHLLHKLVELTAGRAIEHDLAEQIADSIPDPYWRFSALSQVAEELLKRAEQFAGVHSEPGSEFRERGLRLLRKVEGGLSSIREVDGDRASVLWAAGLSLVRAGELEWAESLASTAKYCPENTEVLLRSAEARKALSQTVRAVELARAVAELARIGPGDPANRVYDLESASELAFACGHRDEARKWLEEAAKLALANDMNQGVEGWKCLAAVAIAFAKQGYTDEATLRANAIHWPYWREHALKKIAEVAVAT